MLVPPFLNFCVEIFIFIVMLLGGGIFWTSLGPVSEDPVIEISPSKREHSLLTCHHVRKWQEDILYESRNSLSLDKLPAP